MKIIPDEKSNNIATQIKYFNPTIDNVSRRKRNSVDVNMNFAFKKNIESINQKMLEINNVAISDSEKIKNKEIKITSKIPEKEEDDLNEMMFSDYKSSDEDSDIYEKKISKISRISMNDEKIYKIAEVSNFEEGDSVVNENEGKSNILKDFFEEKNVKENEKNFEYDFNYNSLSSSLKDKEGEDLVEKYKEKAILLPDSVENIKLSSKEIENQEGLKDFRLENLEEKKDDLKL